MDYKARFYSPALGRFLQPDTIVPDPASRQSWNRFSYVVNRPTAFNDPSGHTYLCDEECEEEQDDIKYCSTHPFASKCLPPAPQDTIAESCYVQITTENYWINTCENVPGSILTYYINDPAAFVIYFYQHDSVTDGWVYGTVDMAGNLITPGGRAYRRFDRIAMQFLIETGALMVDTAGQIVLVPRSTTATVADLAVNTGSTGVYGGYNPVILTMYSNVYTKNNQSRGNPNGPTFTPSSSFVIVASQVGSSSSTPLYLMGWHKEEIVGYMPGALNDTPGWDIRK